ncbi:MAG: YihY/virulence factor BrkB family protein [Nevskia sp.]|jgi:membrane protein|nr:YihY/virulence factor BrkB family protein [Nevskia sp.]
MLPNPYQSIHAWLWAREPSSPLERRALHLARYALALLRDLIEGEISLRAMSLVYTTLLSLVPFLALAFSVLKALGVHNSLQPILLKLLEPLGDQATVITSSIIGFVNNIKVGVLGSIGVGMLLYTALSMISKIESSFNFIWKIDQTRGFTQRFGEYLSVLIVGPVLVFSALGITASVRSSTVVTRLAEIEPFGTAILALTELAPYALIVGAFTFMYGFIPNVRVRWRSAAAGGLFAGIAWQSASIGFARFVGSAGSYSAIYSGFAIIIILLIWLYLGWLIILFGCRLAFYIQHPRYLAGTAEAAPPGSRAAEFLALQLTAQVARRFLNGEPALSLDALRRGLGTSDAELERALTKLTRCGVITETQPGRQLLLARDPASYTLAELWQWCRGDAPHRNGRAGDEYRIFEFLDQIELATHTAAAISFRDWLLAEPQSTSSSGIESSVSAATTAHFQPTEQRF